MPMCSSHASRLRINGQVAGRWQPPRVMSMSLRLARRGPCRRRRAAPGCCQNQDSPEPGLAWSIQDGAVGLVSAARRLRVLHQRHRSRRTDPWQAIVIQPAASKNRLLRMTVVGAMSRRRLGRGGRRRSVSLRGTAEPSYGLARTSYCRSIFMRSVGIAFAGRCRAC